MFIPPIDLRIKGYDNEQVTQDDGTPKPAKKASVKVVISTFDVNNMIATCYTNIPGVVLGEDLGGHRTPLDMDVSGAAIQDGEAVELTFILDDLNASFMPDVAANRYAVLAGHKEYLDQIKDSSIYTNGQGRIHKVKFLCYRKAGVTDPILFSLGVVVNSGSFQVPIFYDPKVKNDGVGSRIRTAKSGREAKKRSGLETIP